MSTKHTPDMCGEYARWLSDDAAMWAEGRCVLPKGHDDGHLPNRRNLSPPEGYDRRTPAAARAPDMAEVERLKAALVEVAKGDGPYNRDPLEHASNCIEHMQETARAAIEGAKP